APALSATLQARAPAPKPAAPPVQPAAAATVKAPPPEPTVQMPSMSAAAAVNNVRQVIDELDDLSDTQTIRLLERHSPYREGSREADVGEAIRHGEGSTTRHLQRLHALHHRGESRGPHLVWPASRVLQRCGLGEAG